jgi:trk system potassium uptake protein TrkA
MSMNVIIAGGGRVGAYLASKLLAQGYNVKVIEVHKTELPRLQKELPSAVIVVGSGTDPTVLEAAGIHQAQVVAAVSGSDESNLVVANLARFEFGVPRIIARVNDPKNAWMFTSDMGVDVALNQADLMASLIAEEMSLGDMMTLLKLRKGQYSLVEEKVHPASVAAGKALCDLQLPAECVLTAIIRKGELIIPRGDTVLQPADEVLSVVHAAQLNQLAALLGPAA